MFMRVLLVATIVNSGLFQPLSLPLVLMTLTIFGFAVLYWVWKRERAVIAPLTLHNPVELLRATQFGVLLAFVLLLTKAIQAWLGHTGIYLLAGISGVADVDAITISLARLAGTDLSIQVSSVAVVLATMVNTITKTILAMIIGGRTMGILVAWPLTIGLAVGAMASWHLLF